MNQSRTFDISDPIMDQLIHFCQSGRGKGLMFRSWHESYFMVITHRIHGTGIFTYIYHKNQLNIGKHTIHGWHGLYTSKQIQNSVNKNSRKKTFCFLQQVWVLLHVLHVQNSWFRNCRGFYADSQIVFVCRWVIRCYSYSSIGFPKINYKHVSYSPQQKCHAEKYQVVGPPKHQLLSRGTELYSYRVLLFAPVTSVFFHQLPMGLLTSLMTSSGPILCWAYSVSILIW